MALELSLNSQEYTSSQTTYLYYPPHSLTGVSPSLGPASGETAINISGVNLGGNGSDYRCRFNNTWITATAFGDGIVCTTPPMSTVGATPLHVTLNGQQFDAAGLSFGYLAPPRVLSVSPSAGPTDGDTAIYVRGAFDVAHTTFGPHYFCAFGATWVPASLYNATTVQCVSPPLNLSLGALEVTLNGQQLTRSGVSFGGYAPMEIDSLSPETGPVEGNTTIIVRGSGLEGGCDYRCSYSPNATTVAPNTILAASYDRDAGVLRCVTPPGASHTLSLSLNAQQYTLTNFSWFERPQLDVLSPSSGPLLGSTTIRVTGSGFADTWGTVGGGTLCRMGDHISAGTRDDDGTLWCHSPPLTSLAGTAADTFHTFSAPPAEGSLLGNATVRDGTLRLGGPPPENGEDFGAIVMDPLLPAGVLPPLTQFELSFDVWAPAAPHQQAPGSSYEHYKDAEQVIGDVFLSDGDIDYYPGPRDVGIRQLKPGVMDDVSGGFPASGYALSFGNLYAAAPRAPANSARRRRRRASSCSRLAPRAPAAASACCSGCRRRGWSRIASGAATTPTRSTTRAARSGTSAPM